MPRFYTLGPKGSCHEYAVREYLNYQSVTDYDIVLMDDFVTAAKQAIADKGSYLLQCSAHTEVNLVTQGFYQHLPVVDTFILATQPMAIVKRRDVARPRRLGLAIPTMGYINKDDWEELVFETSKPIVGDNLLQGAYDAGIAYISTATENPDKIEIMREIGSVVTTWLVYGPRPRYKGTIIAAPYPALHEKDRLPADA